MTEFLKNFKFNFRYTIALIVVIGSFGSLYLLSHYEIPDGNKELYSMALGVILNASIGRVMRALFPEKEEVKSHKATDS